MTMIDSTPAQRSDHGITIATVDLPAGRPLRASCLCGWQSSIVPSRPQAIDAGNTHVRDNAHGSQQRVRDAVAAARKAFDDSIEDVRQASYDRGYEHGLSVAEAAD